MSFSRCRFGPCPSGCGHFLSADDGHYRCLQCLGFQHAEDAFVDDSCACCGRVSMISQRSRLSFLKGLAPSYSSRSEHPVWFQGDFAGPSYGAPSISFGVPSVDRISITASGMGSRPLRMKVRWGCPPRVLSPPPHRTQS